MGQPTDPLETAGCVGPIDYSLYVVCAGPRPCVPAKQAKPKAHRRYRAWIAWEFLRRIPEYQGDYRRYAEWKAAGEKKPSRSSSEPIEWWDVYPSAKSGETQADYIKRVKGEFIAVTPDRVIQRKWALRGEPGDPGKGWSKSAHPPKFRAIRVYSTRGEDVDAKQFKRALVSIYQHQVLVLIDLFALESRVLGDLKARLGKRWKHARNSDDLRQTFFGVQVTPFRERTSPERYDTLLDTLDKHIARFVHSERMSAAALSRDRNAAEILAGQQKLSPVKAASPSARLKDAIAVMAGYRTIVFPGTKDKSGALTTSKKRKDAGSIP